jgi:peptide/nickel transport system substrate-binding protein
LVWNATIDRRDERGRVHPHLVEQLPQLHSPSWHVFPDGQMETRYRLKPDLTWHDGIAVTAEDFVFALQIYKDPSFGQSGGVIALIHEVQAPDPGAIVIRWKQPYPEAGALDKDFPPLPRHLLAAPYREVDPAAFANLPYWSSEYVGLGPYRLERREPGLALTGVAFAGYALGRPKIDRIRITFMADANTAIAAILAGEAHLTTDNLLYVEQGTILKQEWAARRSPGTVFWFPVGYRVMQIQLRPEFATPRELLEVRVRRAIAHAFDVPTLVEVLTGGHGLAAGSLTHPLAESWPAVEQTLVRYPYDVRAAQRLLAEAGLSRGADGLVHTAGGTGFKVDLAYIVGPGSARENATLVDNLARVGVEAVGQAFTALEASDNETRAKLPGLFVGGTGGLQAYTSAQIPSATNRWRGSNRGGWTNEEYDRLWSAYTTTSEDAERDRQVAAMERIFSEQVGGIPLYFNPKVTAFVADLQGPVAREHPEAGYPIAQVHEWQWRDRH